MENDAEMLRKWAGFVVDYYGADNQKIVCLEEMGELTQAITKDLRGNPNLKNLAEEIGDVLLTIEQLIVIYGDVSGTNFRKSVKHSMVDKMMRTVSRINEDKERSRNNG